MCALARIVLATAAVLASAPTAAVALSLPEPPDWIWQQVTADGRSALLARHPSGSMTTWRRCGAAPSGIRCVTLASSPSLVLRDEDAHTLIHATAPDGTLGVIAFGGRIRAAEPPVVVGEPRVGTLVRAQGARWAGGFGGEQSHVQLQACRDASGSGCVPMTDTASWDRCIASGARVPSRYAGWYLRAVDRRIDEMTAWPAIGYTTPEAVPALAPGDAATAASPVVGPVADGEAVDDGCVPPRPGPPGGDDGARDEPAAAIRLRGRAGRAGPGQLVVGRARCERRCRVRVVLARRGRRAAHTATLPAGRWRRLALPRRVARRVGPGRARLRVTTRGARAARRTVMLPRRLLR